MKYAGTVLSPKADCRTVIFCNNRLFHINYELLKISNDFNNSFSIK